MKKTYIAHIRKDDPACIQTVKEHSENAAKLCSEYAIPEMKDFLYAVGLIHDVGKFQPLFQRRITGENIRVEHSTCGAIAARNTYDGIVSLMMEYCIAGHHSGIPDGGFSSDSPELLTLQGRMKRDFEDFSPYKEELELPEIDSRSFGEFLMRDCGGKIECFVDKFAFLTRYAFSCLVDADSIDTANFCQGEEPARLLHGDFEACLRRINQRLGSFRCETSLQKARAQLQQQAFCRAKDDAEIYLLNMPTGSGKTLASAKIALERAIAGNKKRIIYVIPYNSIIDQTVEEFEKTFQKDMELLRHQSTFLYEEREDLEEDYRKAAKYAAENWDAKCIVTTAVQFFETMYSNKRGKLRKLHNMSDSIIVFDEAHLMPVPYLQPCLQAIAYLTRYLNSEALFLTATMPDFERLVREYALPDSDIKSLIQDLSLFSHFQKCRYTYLGAVTEDKLVEKGSICPSKLIVVNRKATAQALFDLCKPSGKVFHLSTYMTPYDRKRILEDIRKELKFLQKDFPDEKEIPEDRRITIISTSLIEAGVDLDVHTVFRETAGLDNILQAGGRCNREGRREWGDVYIFDLEDGKEKRTGDVRSSLARGLMQKYEDISAPDCIREYYDRLYFLNRDEIQKNTMHQSAKSAATIPFRTYAKEFEIIDSKTVSLVVERDEKSKHLVEKLRDGERISSRQLQNYTCSLYQWEIEDLVQQHAADDFGTGIYCLTSLQYYDENIGISFTATDFYI